jgi:hypothetical protein
VQLDDEAEAAAMEGADEVRRGFAAGLGAQLLKGAGARWLERPPGPCSHAPTAPQLVMPAQTAAADEEEEEVFAEATRGEAGGPATSSAGVDSDKAVLVSKVRRGAGEGRRRRRGSQRFRGRVVSRGAAG